jgi:hypothetical protein
MDAVATCHTVSQTRNEMRLQLLHFSNASTLSLSIVSESHWRCHYLAAINKLSSNTTAQRGRDQVLLQLEIGFHMESGWRTSGWLVQHHDDIAYFASMGYQLRDGSYRVNVPKSACSLDLSRESIDDVTTRLAFSSFREKLMKGTLGPPCS